ncbi:MAG: cold shock domain-containing protein [candidate division NC10 bacterium]|nr:cold shock domain-containing protein [candidate division NC10 bacterium]
MRGSVKWFNQAKGYGFIARDDGGADTFVHLSDILEGRVLGPGDRVEFQVAQDQRGRSKAVRVKLLAKGTTEEPQERPAQARTERSVEEEEPFRDKLEQTQATLSETAAHLETLIQLLVEKGIITRQEMEERTGEKQRAEEAAFE